MTTTHTNLALVEGDVYILSDEQKFKDKYVLINGKRIQKEDDTPFNRERFFIDENMLVPGFTKLILASTVKLEGVALLDRKHFVKPKVDVEELAEEKADEKYYPKSEIKPHFINGFKAGYNAKEAEFTEDDLRKALAVIIRYPKLTIDDVLNKLRALSLPKSVTLNENNEVVAVEWDQ